MKVLVDKDMLEGILHALVTSHNLLVTDIEDKDCTWHLDFSKEIDELISEIEETSIETQFISKNIPKYKELCRTITPCKVLEMESGEIQLITNAEAWAFNEPPNTPLAEFLTDTINSMPLIFNMLDKFDQNDLVYGTQLLDGIESYGITDFRSDRSEMINYLNRMMNISITAINTFRFVSAWDKYIETYKRFKNTTHRCI